MLTAAALPSGSVGLSPPGYDAVCMSTPGGFSGLSIEVNDIYGKVRVLCRSAEELAVIIQYETRDSARFVFLAWYCSPSPAACVD